MKKQATKKRGRAGKGSREAGSARSARIAPTVQRFLGECEAFELAEDDVAAFKREVRALLAVARAAKEQCRDEWGGLPGDELKADSKLSRALSRLARAGKSRGDETNG